MRRARRESVTARIAPGEQVGLLTGWWFVLLLLLPALMFQSFLLPYRSHAGHIEEMPLFVADVLIAFRAVYAISLQDDRSRWWLLYCCLYFVLPIVAAVAYDVLQGTWR
jgi:hypothetical protein